MNPFEDYMNFYPYTEDKAEELLAKAKQPSDSKIIKEINDFFDTAMERVVGLRAQTVLQKVLPQGVGIFMGLEFDNADSIISECQTLYSAVKQLPARSIKLVMILRYMRLINAILALGDA